MQSWVAVSVALLEIIIGAIAGNLVDMPLTPWLNYLAGFGAVLLTFLAGAEIDAKVIRRHFGSTMAIGAVGFFAPYLGVLGWAHFISGWPWPQAQIAGIALSTTSVAVVYAVMIETGFNDTEIGKVILASCFINDISTVLAPVFLGDTTESRMLVLARRVVSRCRRSRALACDVVRQGMTALRSSRCST